MLIKNIRLNSLGNSICILFLCFVISACPSTSTHKKLTEIEYKTYLPFIELGVTTREQVILSLGIPSFQYEKGRIIAYKLYKENDTGKLIPINHDATTHDLNYDTYWSNLFDLVIVFNENNTIEKVSFFQMPSYRY